MVGRLRVGARRRVSPPFRARKALGQRRHGDRHGRVTFVGLYRDVQLARSRETSRLRKLAYMAWVKVPPENHPIFHAALPKDPRVETLKMFGGVAAKVNGHLFA